MAVGTFHFQNYFMASLYPISNTKSVISFSTPPHSQFIRWSFVWRFV